MGEWVGGVTQGVRRDGASGCRRDSRYTVWFGRMKSPTEVIAVERPHHFRSRFGNWLLRGETDATFEAIARGDPHHRGLPRDRRDPRDRGLGLLPRGSTAAASKARSAHSQVVCPTRRRGAPDRSLAAPRLPLATASERGSRQAAAPAPARTRSPTRAVRKARTRVRGSRQASRGRPAFQQVASSISRRPSPGRSRPRAGAARAGRRAPR